MKISLDIDCTPEEARRFLGMPDVAAMNEQVVADMQKRMLANLAAMDPEQLFKTWMPAGLQGLEQMQKMFWQQMAAASAKGGGKTSDKKDE